MTKTAIIGFGCAGYHGAKAMRKEGYQGEIDVFSQTDAPPANPMLTTYYASERLPKRGLYPFGDLDEIKEELKLNIFTKTPVVKLDSANLRITLADGTSKEYDKILIATGASPFVPPLKGVDSPKVICMRTEEDAEELKQALEGDTIKKVVVVGASMVGIKIIEMLVNKGISSALVDLAPNLFSAAALPEVAVVLEEDLKKRGVECLFSAELQGFSPIEGDRIRCNFADGSEVDCDLVALCIGTKANTQLADTGIKVDRAIIVDEYMRTTAEGIYSAGDCCAAINLLTGNHQSIGLWQNAAQQGEVAGVNMAGGKKRFPGSIPCNITHYFDVDFIGIGDCRAKGDVLNYERDGFLLRAVKTEGKLSCVNLVGNYKVSGVLKNYFVKQLEEPTAFSPMLRARMLRQGIPNDLIAELEVFHD